MPSDSALSLGGRSAWHRRSGSSSSWSRSLVALVIRTFVVAHFVVPSTSMDRHADTGDRVLVNKLSYRLHDPQPW